jgi:hypothetical protein
LFPSARYDGGAESSRLQNRQFISAVKDKVKQHERVLASQQSQMDGADFSRGSGAKPAHKSKSFGQGQFPEPFQSVCAAGEETCIHFRKRQ